MSDSSILFRKTKNKTLKALSKVPPCYSALASLSNILQPTLPLPSQSREALLRAAPYLEWGGVRPRRWPDEPQVDVSVVVPCFNAERFVGACIDSIMSQETDLSFEVVAVDDGSTDATGAILDAVASRSPVLRVIHQRNQGFSGARNSGIAGARGANLMFVDSDDLLKPGAIESLGTAIESAGTDIVTASYENMSEDGKRATPIEGRRTHGAPWGRIYCREVWRDVDFPEGYWFEDTVQGFLIDPRFSQAYLDESVYLYRRNGEGITARCSSSKKGLDSFWVVEALLNRADELGIPYDRQMHDRVVHQLGPILWWRCAALSPVEKKALFVSACELYAKRAGGMSCSRGGRWADLEKALRERNYPLWRLAIYALS